MPRLLLLAGLMLTAFATLSIAGSLTPPGDPAPTMKPLDQIEPRTAITALPFTISQSGSYYMASSLQNTVSGTAITVQVPDVTIDLGGFTLLGHPAQTGPGIQIHADNVLVTNGTITGCSTGVYSNGNSMIVMDGLRVHGNGSTGITINGGGIKIIRNCVIANNTHSGISTDTYAIIQDNLIDSNGANGINNVSLGSKVVGNIVSRNGQYGIKAIAGSILYKNNVVQDNNQLGGFDELSGVGGGVYVDNIPGIL